MSAAMSATAATPARAQRWHLSRAFVTHVWVLVVAAIAWEAGARSAGVFWFPPLTTILEHAQQLWFSGPASSLWVTPGFVTDVLSWRLLKQALCVLALVIGGFVFAHQLHLEPGTIALSGAALLLLLDNWPRDAEAQTHNVHESFGEVEWVTIFFFIGLFAIVAGVEHAGLLRLMADQLAAWTGGDLAVAAVAILWVSAILSAIIDNIPFVATMIPVVQGMAPAFGGEEQIMPLWWALSLGACLGGNGTLIGASANLTVAGIAERAGVPFRFVPFMLLAFPMMLMSIAISTVYMYMVFL